MRHRMIPKFKSDREAAAFWDRHGSTSYLSDLKEVTVQVLPALRKQIAARQGPQRPTASDGRRSAPN